MGTSPPPSPPSENPFPAEVTVDDVPTMPPHAAAPFPALVPVLPAPVPAVAPAHAPVSGSVSVPAVDTAGATSSPPALIVAASPNPRPVDHTTAMSHHAGCARRLQQLAVDARARGDDAAAAAHDTAVATHQAMARQHQAAMGLDEYDEDGSSQNDNDDDGDRVYDRAPPGDVQHQERHQQQRDCPERQLNEDQRKDTDGCRPKRRRSGASPAPASLTLLASAASAAAAAAAAAAASHEQELMAPPESFGFVRVPESALQLALPPEEPRATVHQQPGQRSRGNTAVDKNKNTAVNETGVSGIDASANVGVIDQQSWFYDQSTGALHRDEAMAELMLAGVRDAAVATWVHEGAGGCVSTPTPVPTVVVSSTPTATAGDSRGTAHSNTTQTTAGGQQPSDARTTATGSEKAGGSDVSSTSLPTPQTPQSS